MSTARLPASGRSAHWLVAFVLTGLCCALAELAASLLAVAPAYARPLCPAAGIALASVLVFGRRMLPAIALGALAVPLAFTRPYDPYGAVSLPFSLPFVLPASLPLALAIGLGSALQAWAGASLVKRYTRQPLTLSEPRDLVVFLLAAMVACLVSAAAADMALWATHPIAASDLPFGFMTWWFGELTGTLIVTPILLTLLGRPRDAWAPRRLSVGLTLTLLTLLLALGIRQVALWSSERVRIAFDHAATSASQALASHLGDPLQALAAMNSLFIASQEVTADEMRLATRAWLAPGTLQAIAWSEHVRRDDLADFEARVRAGGNAAYTVFDRTDVPVTAPSTAPTTAAPPRDPGSDVIAVRYIEPLAGNAAAIGLNLLSIPATRVAVDRSWRTGQPSATAGLRLTQQPAGGSAVVIYQAVYQPALPTDAERAAALRGVVSVVLRIDDELKTLAAQIPAYLALCLIDATPGATIRRLAGNAGCETQANELQHVRPLSFAGRQWEVRVSANRAGLPEMHSGDVWLFALVGLLSTATLGGFLLIVTGRTRLIETAVFERTAALQAEVREREVAEAALRESEQRFRNILNHVPIGVIYTDLRGNVKQANPRFCTLTGYGESELLQLSLSDYTHPEDLEHDIELMAQLVHGDIPMYRRNTRYIARHGAIVWVQTTVSLLRDSKGKPRSIVGVVEDVTEHLKLEEAERAREAAEASNRAKSDFLSRMSHELRTPLNAMLGFAQLLELDTRHPLAPSQQPWVSQIQQAGWHLLEMINDVLDLSRIESGNLRLQVETLELSDLLDACIAMVDVDARQRQITITRDFSPGHASVLGDGTRVKQILTNLLSNAVKYNSPGGRIDITSRVLEPDLVEIAVTDTGLGMTQKQMAELFQPFNRLGRERSAQQGTGIGLVISQRLAELMGGSLRAHSAAGRGSAFVLTLPGSTDPDTVRSDLAVLAPEPAEYHTRLVHYVEDNETNVEVMRGVLAQRPQVEMQVSMTGLEGLDSIRARRPDLVLLDMHLPDISGMELLRHLKADPNTAGIPVVVVSADALAHQIEEAFDAGCSHYLTKPVSVGELLSVVDELLDQIDTRFG